MHLLLESLPRSYQMAAAPPELADDTSTGDNDIGVTNDIPDVPVHRLRFFPRPYVSSLGRHAHLPSTCCGVCNWRFARPSPALG